MDESGKEGTGSQDNRAATERYADLGCDADRAIAFEQDVVDLLLEQPQIGLVLKSAPDRVRYSTRSACARVARTAGPLEAFSVRNWIPASSVASAMAPSSASISLAR